MPNLSLNIAGAPGVSRDLQTPTWASTGSALAVPDRCYAQYVGQVPFALSEIDLSIYVQGSPAAGAGYAELGLATSDDASNAANINLTIVGYVSIDAEVKGVSTVIYTKTLSGINVPAGKDLWVVVAASYATTQPTFRFPSEGDLHGYGRTRAACRPSTNLNTPLAFAYPALSSVPGMRARVR
jgi:hypothetical protein